MINLFDRSPKVLVADVSTEKKNGYTFSEEALKSMYSDIKEKEIFGQLGSIGDSGGIDLTKVTHKCYSPELDDGKLYCKVKFLDTPYVEQALGYLKENSFELFTFKPEGEHKVDPTTDQIYDYNLNSINLFIESEE